MSHPHPPFCRHDQQADSTESTSGTKIRYGEYVAQLGIGTIVERSAEGASLSSGRDKESKGRREEAEEAGEAAAKRSAEACKESLRRLDGLWEVLSSSLGFVIPLLKEVLVDIVVAVMSLVVVVVMTVAAGGTILMALPGAVAV